MSVRLRKITATVLTALISLYGVFGLALLFMEVLPPFGAVLVTWPIWLTPITALVMLVSIFIPILIMAVLALTIHYLLSKLLKVEWTL